MKFVRSLPFLLSLIVITFLQFSCDDIINLQDELCEGTDCFSIESFAENLDSRLSSTTLGYSYAIYYEQTLQKWGHGGQARRSQDGNVFDVDAIQVDMNVASCAKSITTIATLQVLEANSIPVTAKIVDYLPDWWTIGSDVDMITFEQLLRQRSGFRPASDAVNYAQIKAEVANGIDAADNGVENYQNMNFCILRILIPILDNTFSRTNEVTDNVGATETTDLFKSYLQDHIFDQLLVNFSCDNDDEVLYYNFNNPAGNGWDPGDECGNAGGGTLSLSANDLCKTMHYAATTTDLISAAMRDAMFLESKPLGCYSNQVNGSEDWGEQFHHNGGFADSAGRGAAACWYHFHNGVTVAVSSNSAGGISTNGFANVNDLIEQAFDASWD
ncbi:MAG: beta-lactamase family protein [Bacteroidetes bacterium]|nr:beta-lactamase family protein [Bacteroidota bacterium]